MAFGARRTGLVVIFCLLGGTTATLAQEKPAGTWTEPPVRGAAGPQDGATGKPSEPVAEAPRAGKAAGTAADRTTGRAGSRDAGRTAEREDGRAERSTKLRRARIRREAVRAAEADAAAEAARTARRSRQAHRRERLRVSAATEAGSARDHAEERAATSAARPNRAGLGTPNRRGTRHRQDDGLYAYRAYPATPRPRFAWPRQTIAEDMPPREAPHRMRRAGWGYLLGDSRARRIADAQAAGYIVMRSRTIEYPDGTRVRSLRPYEPDFDSLD